MLGKGAIKYLILGAMLIVFGSTILNSIVSIVEQAKHGSIAPIILIMITAVIVIRFAGSKSKGTGGAYTEKAYWLAYAFVTVYISIIVGLALFTTTAALYLGAAGFGLTAIGCKALYESGSDGLSLKERFALLMSSTKASMNSTTMGSWSSGSIAWKSSDKSRVVIIPDQELESIISLMKERSSLPVSLTHLPDMNCLVIPTENGWYSKTVNMIKEHGIQEIKRAPRLLEIAIISLPLIIESRIQDSLEYGLTQNETIVNKLLEQWPVGLTLFPHKDGLKAIVPVDKAPGYELEELSRVNALRLLVNRDARAFPQGGTEIVDTT